MSRAQRSTETLNNTAVALEAVRRGYQPVPLVSGDKKSRTSGWPRLRWSNTPEGLALVQEKFDAWAADGHGGIGVLLGEPSGGLVDVDLDHPKTARLKDHFLPRTAMRSGRPGRPGTHYWYITEPGTLQEARTFKLPAEREDPDKRMIVEYRSTGGQTALPGNVHPSGETYTWQGEPWGGAEGPAVVDGRMLAVQVALLGFCTLLVNYWPGAGSRHETYLALAGGLLRVGDGVHPYWERNAPIIIAAIADATHDEDGADTRVAEVMGSTLKRLREGKPAAGFGKLGELIGEDVVRQARVILADIEALAGVPARTSGSFSVEGIAAALDNGGGEERDEKPDDEELPDLALDPLEARQGTWEALDLDPYLTGQVQTVEPTVMVRRDGQALMYPGRLNMLYGPSESAKSWIAMHTCLRMIESGARVVYLDFEDEPVNALSRLRVLGAGYDDIRTGFSYVRPEEPLASMMRSRWGEDRSNERAKLNEQLFQKLLDKRDPALIVADGMTVLYGLHGLDSNDSVQTDIITTWLKTLTRNGRTTVIVVDHTAKNPARGSLPIGSQHKVSMVQGTLLQAYPVRQPMPGAVGEIELIVLKDRPGKVRAASEKSGEKAQLAAKVVIDSTHDGQTTIDLQVPPKVADKAGAQKKGKTAAEIELDLRQARAAENAERERAENEDVLRLFGGDLSVKLSTPDMRAMLFGAEPSDEELLLLKRVQRRLMKQGWLAMEGNTRNAVYSLIVGEVDDTSKVVDDASSE